MEKRFDPSKKRLDKARQEGNVAKSQHLSQALGTALGLAICFYYLANSWVDHKILLEYLWTDGFASPLEATKRVADKYLLLCVKLLTIMAAANILIEVAQVGLNLEISLLSFKLERLDPVGGSKKIFENLKNSWQVVLRLFLVCCALYWFFSGVLDDLTGSLTLISTSATAVGMGWVKKLLFTMCSLMLLLGVFDYYMQRRKWFQKVGMSFEDMRNEHKEDEGDPHIKAARKARHQELVMQNLVKKIRSSKVIIVERAK